ncbi:ROK family protein [Aestuariivirga sp.]|uniref:ROK family protein n=1 Tax=Aestuariivirga sp. TaxID=2650926 RepID=UPI0039E6CE2C
MLRTRSVIGEKADSELVRRQNRRVVLDMLRHAGPLARVELGQRTGLSPATITAISGQLIEQGLLEALEESLEAEQRQRRGRPMTRLHLAPQAAHVLAVKLSIDGVELVLADFRGAILRRQLLHISTYEADPGLFGQSVAEEIAQFLGKAMLKRRSVVRIGVAVQGVANTQAGTVVWSPAFRARNIPVAGPVSERLGIRCTVANDANMIAEALAAQDRAAAGTTCVVFTGYGVGGALIINGQVYHGETGAAAEFGHMNHVPHGLLCRCGRRGCVEAYAADYAIARAAGLGRTEEPPLSAIADQEMAEIEERAAAGDQAALEAFARAGEALGFGIARVIAMLSPARIVLSGPGTRAIGLMEQAMRAAIADGVVEELRRNVSIDVVPIATDMIVKGTIGMALRDLDEAISSSGPIEAFALPVQTVA